MLEAWYGTALDTGPEAERGFAGVGLYSVGQCQSTAVTDRCRNWSDSEGKLMLVISGLIRTSQVQHLICEPGN